MENKRFIVNLLEIFDLLLKNLKKSLILILADNSLGNIIVLYCVYANHTSILIKKYLKMN